jgi:hypothetical protein
MDPCELQGWANQDAVVGYLGYHKDFLGVYIFFGIRNEMEVGQKLSIFRN